MQIQTQSYEQQIQQFDQLILIIKKECLPNIFCQKQIKYFENMQRHKLLKCIHISELISNQQQKLIMQPLAHTLSHHESLKTIYASINQEVLQSRKQIRKSVESLEKYKSENAVLSNQLFELRRVSRSNQKTHQIAQSMSRDQMVRRNTENQFVIIELNKELEKWKQLRVGEENQLRKFKSRIKQLEQLLADETEKGKDQQKKARQDLQRQKGLFNNAMDEIQKEYRNLLGDCETRLRLKDEEINSLRYQLNGASFEGMKHIQIENEQLRRDLQILSLEMNKIESYSKKLQEENRHLNYEFKMLSKQDKNVDDKIMQIQRLKIEIKDLSEQNNKNNFNRRQIQNLQNVLKIKEKEDRQKNQRILYLQKMLETYEREIQTYKIVKQQLSAKCKGYQRCQIQKSQLEKILVKMGDELEIEKDRSQRKLEERVDEYQVIIKQWKSKYESCVEDRVKMKIYEEQVRENQFQSKQWKEKFENIKRDMIIIQERSARQKSKFQDKISQLLVEIERKDKQSRAQDKKQKQLLRILSQNENRLQDMILKYDRFQKQLGELTEYKVRYEMAEQRQNSYMKVIDDQKKSLQQLSLQVNQKTHDICNLLSKIDMLEQSLDSNHTKAIAAELQFRQKRHQHYLRLCSLSKLEGSFVRIEFCENEDKFLRCVYENMRLLIEQVKEGENYKQKVKLLNEQKQNIESKYKKLKAVVGKRKQEIQQEKLIMRNTFRFNDQIISHCQNLIKGAEIINLRN